MKIVLYARVSKPNDRTPENQLIVLRKWAKDRGDEVIGEFVDELSSKGTRPKKEEVLKLLRRGEIDGVLFWSLDRWGRTMSELVLEIEEFSGGDKMLFSYQEALDLSTASGRLASFLLSALANFERDRIRERTLAGLARVKAQGKKLGRPRKEGGSA